MMKTLLVFKQEEQSDYGQDLGKEWGEVVTAQTKEQFYKRLEEPFDVIAVHTRLFHDVYPWDWMNALRTAKPDARVVIALDETVYDSLMLEVLVRMAGESGYTILPAGSTAQEATRGFAAFMSGLGKGQRKSGHRTGKVAAVWSAASKDGATTVAVNTALAIAALSKLNVGLIDANLRNPEIRPHLNLDHNNPSHFQLRPKLQTQTLLPEELLKTCSTYRKMPRLHILTGTQRRDTAADMTPEMMAHLLQTARQTFDITIVDLNAYPDNAATVCAVRDADIRMLVTQNNYASYRVSWGEWYECYWKYCGIPLSDISLIVNRVTAEDKPERLAETLQMPLLGAVPNVGGALGLKAVHEGVPLYLQPKAEAFISSVNGLASSLAEENSRDYAMGTALQTQKTGWISRISALFV